VKVALSFDFSSLDRLFVDLERREAVDRQEVDIRLLLCDHFLDLELDDKSLGLRLLVVRHPSYSLVCENLSLQDLGEGLVRSQQRLAGPQEAIPARYQYFELRTVQLSSAGEAVIYGSWHDTDHLFRDALIQIVKMAF